MNDRAHQNFRISEGGYFLECFEGVLSEIYKKQGFKVVARLKFDENFAPLNWEKNEVLKNKPDIVFMSLFSVDKIETFEKYEQAEILAIATGLQK